MLVAQCVFENWSGLSKSYHYEVSENQLKKLKKGDHVVVTGSNARYNIAIFTGTVILKTPEEKAIVTQHICCKVIDTF